MTVPEFIKVNKSISTKKKWQKIIKKNNYCTRHIKYIGNEFYKLKSRIPTEES